MIPTQIAKAIGTTQGVLVKLQHGLLAGNPLDEMESLAKDISLAALRIEAMVSDRRERPQSKL